MTQENILENNTYHIVLCHFRYWAVTQVHYIHSRTIKTIGTMIALIWGISITVSLAPLFGWKDPDFEKRVNTEKQCIVSQDLSYQIFATMSTFYVPLVIILLLYWRIFMTARTRLRKRLAAKANVDLTNGAGTHVINYISMHISHIYLPFESY